MKTLKLITLTLISLSFTFMGFAEGSKKKDTASHKKVNVKIALQEIFAEELEQFNFKKDFEIANE